jgi:hypothetical protein
MNKRMLYSFLLLFAFSAMSVAQLKDTLTFRVNMSIKMLEGKFKPSLGDTVRVVGTFNNWSASDTTVRMSSTGPTDSIFTLTRILDSSVTASVYDHNDTISYKFYKTNRGGDWESVDNRVYKLVNGKHSTPIWLFDNDSTANLPVTVKFQVNMSIKLRELTFQPQNGDIVRISGSFNGWSNLSSTDTLKSTGSTDSIYTRNVTLNEGDKIFYKFLKTPARGGIDWEGNQPTSSTNREYTVPVGGGNIPLVWFDNDSVYNAALQLNLLWQTDMSPFITLGWFNPAKDSVDVRGGFTGWSSQKMQSNTLTPNIWEYTSQNFIAPIGSSQSYKYYIRFDSATVMTPPVRFPGLIWGGTTDNRDGFAYEHPAVRGDGNNEYVITSAANQIPQRSYFSQISPWGLLKTTDTVNVTLKVNMGPATRYSDPFSPTLDTLYLVFQDAIWRSSQVKAQGSFAAERKMTRQSSTDSVFTYTFKVVGKTHYGMHYTYRYNRSTGTSVSQGGGLGGQNPYIARFIPFLNGVWPKTYTAPTDQWKKDAPLTGETAPFTTDVENQAAVPLVYQLHQNYPNPFNPTTNIRYVLPIQSKVSLKVYNILGQVVANLMDQIQPAGNHVVGFDASRLATGVYFYRLEAGTFREVKKMMLIK